MDVEQKIVKIAKKRSVRILLVEGEDERVLSAAAISVREGTAAPVLLGNKQRIISMAARRNINLNGMDIIEHIVLDDDIDSLALLRKEKGVTREKAAELLKDPNYFAALKLKRGKADGALGGCLYSTAQWMRPVFQVIGKADGVSIISAICFVKLEDRTLFFSDTDFVIQPTYQELAQIALNAADFVEKLGIIPKIGLLSYSTHGSGEHPSLDKIRSALDLVRKTRKDLVIDGEIQFDAATNPKSAQRKCPDSPLNGEANILIFPDITVGNVLIHALTQLTGFKMYGSFPVGLAKPVINGGRSWNDRQVADAITACAAEVNLS